MSFFMFFFFFCLTDGKCTYLANYTRCGKIDFYMQDIIYRLEIDPMFCILKSLFVVFSLHKLLI